MTEPDVCPGGDSKCWNCEVNVNKISPEKLFKKTQKQLEEEKCATCTADRTCFDKEGILCKRDEMR